MPLHEYECDACGHRFEKIQKFSDPPIEICPKCGGAVRKLISSPAFHLKGTGWYLTDYARKDGVGASKTGGSKEGESGGSDKDSSAKTEASSTATSTPSSASSSDSSSTPAPAKPAAKESKD